METIYLMSKTVRCEAVNNLEIIFYCLMSTIIIYDDLLSDIVYTQRK